MLNWLKKKIGKENIEQKIVTQPEAKTRTSSLDKQEKKQEKSKNKTISGNTHLGSCTLANLINNLMPYKFFPELQKSNVNFKDNIVTVNIGNNNITIECNELSMKQNDQVLVGYYSVITKLNNSKELYEEVSGISNQAIKVYYSAAQNYIAGFFHGYFHALLGNFDEGYVLKNKLGEEWHVSLGNYLIQGRLQEVDDAEGKLFDQILPKLNEFQDELVDTIYGIKIYMAQVNGNEFIGDCRIDNIEFPEGLEELKQKDLKDWPNSDSLMSKKQWIILKKI